MGVRVRRRIAMVALAFGLLAGGAVLTANSSFLAPTSDGGQPGDVGDLLGVRF